MEGACEHVGSCLNNRVTDALQWVGAVAIIIGHIANAIGPKAYPYNILAFFVGIIFFLCWSIRVKNTPQLVVNIVALATCGLGLYKAYI